MCTVFLVSLNLPKRPERPHPQKWDGEKTIAWLEKVHAGISGDVDDASASNSNTRAAFLEQIDLLPPSFCGKGKEWTFSCVCREIRTNNRDLVSFASLKSLSCFVSSLHFLSCLVLCHLFFSCLFFSGLVWSFGLSGAISFLSCLILYSIAL